MKSFQRRAVNRRDFILLACAACAPPARAAGAAPVILVVGDSMSAEYGLPQGSGWVALLRQRLAAQRREASVVNASVSGDTTAGGRSRLAAALARHKPDIVILELGGNDALRGLPLSSTEDNLATMARQVRQAGARLLLVGMQVPPNYGADYTRRFAGLFETLAREHQASLVPFLLEGVANAPDPTALFQADRIHPSVQAQPLLLDNVWKALQPMLS
ncbi:arylesterase [Comamonas sp. NLF-1-9]|uniref:arylesterase n=1 Tax=Comamonas sp. NLF-1-9 TaxID=2853163 RepID=UPI00210760BE|nr:arylesterase [Comamonas sp. NLF-1-9]